MGALLGLDEGDVLGVGVVLPEAVEVDVLVDELVTDPPIMVVAVAVNEEVDVVLGEFDGDTPGGKNVAVDVPVAVDVLVKEPDGVLLGVTLAEGVGGITILSILHPRIRKRVFAIHALYAVEAAAFEVVGGTVTEKFAATGFTGSSPNIAAPNRRRRTL